MIQNIMFGVSKGAFCGQNPTNASKSDVKGTTPTDQVIRIPEKTIIIGHPEILKLRSLITNIYQQKQLTTSMRIDTFQGFYIVHSGVSSYLVTTNTSGYRPHRPQESHSLQTHRNHDTHVPDGSTAQALRSTTQLLRSQMLTTSTNASLHCFCNRSKVKEIKIKNKRRKTEKVRSCERQQCAMH